MRKNMCSCCIGSRCRLDHGCIRHTCFKSKLGLWDPSNCSDCRRNFSAADDPNSPNQMDARERICKLLLRMIDSRGGRNITRPLFASPDIHSQWCRSWFGLHGSPNTFSKIVYRATELLSLTVEPKAFIHFTMANPSFRVEEPISENMARNIFFKRLLSPLKFMSVSTKVRTSDCADDTNYANDTKVKTTPAERALVQCSVSLPAPEESKLKQAFDPGTVPIKQSSPELVPGRETISKPEAPEVAEKSLPMISTTPVFNSVDLKSHVETTEAGFSEQRSNIAASDRAGRVKGLEGKKGKTGKAESSERGSRITPPDDSVDNVLQLSLADVNMIQSGFKSIQSSITGSPAKVASILGTDNLPSKGRLPEFPIPVVAENLSTGCVPSKDLTHAVPENLFTACCSPIKKVEPVLQENSLPNKPLKYATSRDKKLPKASLPAKNAVAASNQTATSAAAINEFETKDNTQEGFTRMDAVQSNVNGKKRPAIEVVEIDSDSSSSNFDQKSVSPLNRTGNGSARDIIAIARPNLPHTRETTIDYGSAKFSYPFGCTPLFSVSYAMRRAISHSSESGFYVVPDSCLIDRNSLSVPGLKKKIHHSDVFLGQLPECRIAFFPLPTKLVKQIIVQWEMFDPTWMSCHRPSRSKMLAYTSSFFKLLNGHQINLCTREVSISSKNSGVFVIDSLDEVVKREAGAFVSSASSEARHAPRDSLSWFILMAQNPEDQAFLKYLQLPMTTQGEALNSKINSIDNQRVDVVTRIRAAEIVKVLQFLSIVETICAEMASQTFPQETRAQVLSMLSHVTSFFRKSLSWTLHSLLEEVVTIHEVLVSETKTQSNVEYTSRQSTSNESPAHETISSTDYFAEDLLMCEPSPMCAKRKRCDYSGDWSGNELSSLNVPYGFFQQTSAENMPYYNSPGRANWECSTQLYDEQSSSPAHFNWPAKKQRF